MRSYSTEPQVWGGAADCVHAFDPEPTAEGYTGKRKWQHTGEITRSTEPENWSQVTRGDTCRHCGAWRGELGGEPTPELYVEHIVEVFREVRRVLRKDGTCWINLGDGMLPDKNEAMIPHRVAMALQADGWICRQTIIWNKPAAMPESVRDRCTKSHEYVFLLSKAARYYFDAAAIAEPASSDPITVARNGRADVGVVGARDLHGTEWGQSGRGGFDRSEIATRNKRSVWTINTEPTTIQHFATFPEKLVEPMILAGTSERGVCQTCGSPWRRVVQRVVTRPGVTGGASWRGVAEHAQISKGLTRPGGFGGGSSETTGWQPSCKHEGDPVPATVLDPFLGSGTAARVAERLGRRWIGIELNENYAEIARRRTAQQSLLAWAGGAS